MSFELDERTFLSSLDSALKRVTHSAERNLSEMGDAVARKAQERAPVETGRLRESIHVEETHEGQELIVDVIADAPYAPFVELGTSDAPAQPFIRPALAEERAEMPRRFEHE